MIGGAAIVGAVAVSVGVLVWFFKSSLIEDLRVWELNRLKTRCRISDLAMNYAAAVNAKQTTTEPSAVWLRPTQQASSAIRAA